MPQRPEGPCATLLAGRAAQRCPAARAAMQLRESDPASPQTRLSAARASPSGGRGRGACHGQSRPARRCNGLQVLQGQGAGEGALGSTARLSAAGGTAPNHPAPALGADAGELLVALGAMRPLRASICLRPARPANPDASWAGAESAAGARAGRLCASGVSLARYLAPRPSAPPVLSSRPLPPPIALSASQRRTPFALPRRDAQTR